MRRWASRRISVTGAGGRSWSPALTHTHAPRDTTTVGNPRTTYDTSIAAPRTPTIKRRTRTRADDTHSPLECSSRSRDVVESSNSSGRNPEVSMALEPAAAHDTEAAAPWRGGCVRESSPAPTRGPACLPACPGSFSLSLPRGACGPLRQAAALRPIRRHCLCLCLCLGLGAAPTQINRS